MAGLYGLAGSDDCAWSGVFVTLRYMGGTTLPVVAAHLRSRSQLHPKLESQRDVKKVENGS
jgi:hypothetical protein